MCVYRLLYSYVFVGMDQKVALDIFKVLYTCAATVTGARPCTLQPPPLLSTDAA